MYVERRYNYIDGLYEYINDQGDLLENFEVYVDGKRVAADIAQLDTTKGWVDIELPVLKETTKINVTDKIVPSEDLVKPESMFDIKVKRLEGKVELKVLGE